MKEASEIVSEYWADDHKGPKYISWLEHPTIVEYIHRRTSGDPKTSTYEWFKQKFFPQPADLCLSLGCGLGAFERGAISIGIAKRFHANDISAGAITKARQSASEAGLADRIEYSVLDLNHATLPKNTYDAIFAISSAHHVFNLEDLFDQCRRALKPDGLFLLDEYIGPNRFQTQPEVINIINRLLGSLPRRYRKSLFTNDGSTVDRYVPSPPEHFLKHDPSEAIRSADIMRLIERNFDIIEFRPYGGGILHMLLSGITGNFDESSKGDVALLRVLATVEQYLEEKALIASDFAAIVARPKYGG